MYRVWFSFRNEVGGNVRDFLDNNGKGFKPSEALYVAGELKAQGKARVNIVRIGSHADTEEWKERMQIWASAEQR